MITWIGLFAATVFPLLDPEASEVSLIGFVRDNSAVVEMRVSEGEPETPIRLFTLPAEYGTERAKIYSNPDFGFVLGVYKHQPDFRGENRVVAIRPANGGISVDFAGEHPIPIEGSDWMTYFSSCHSPQGSVCLYAHNLKGNGTSADILLVEGVMRRRTPPIRVGHSSIAWFDRKTRDLRIVRLSPSDGLELHSDVESHDVPCDPLAYSRMQDAIICWSVAAAPEAFLYSPTSRTIVRKFEHIEGRPVGYLSTTNELLVFDRVRSLVSLKEITVILAIGVDGKTRMLVRPFPVIASTLTFFD